MAGAKGTATPIGSFFSPDDAQKAAQRVADALSARRQDLHRLHSFIADNAALINQVRSIPDDVSHDIMVPFGGAAFFPGRLVHTNEFMVLLGDGYYAERSAKQTVEILKRRGKALEEQVEGLKATMMDLEAEAKFFKSTADEATEGIVEIREEYIEDPQMSFPSLDESDPDTLCSNTNSLQMPNEDEEHEHARIMKILNQLEMNENESESISGDEDDNNADGDNDAKTSSSVSTYQNDNKISPQKNIEQDRMPEYSSSVGIEKVENDSEQHFTDQSSVLESGKHFITETSMFDNKQPNTKEKVPQAASDIRIYEHSSSSALNQASQVRDDTRKAFSGSVIEHDLGLPPVGGSAKSTTTGQPSARNPSKPVSRFKMQRGNR